MFHPSIHSFIHPFIHSFKGRRVSCGPSGVVVKTEPGTDGDVAVKEEEKEDKKETVKKEEREKEKEKERERSTRGGGGAKEERDKPGGSSGQSEEASGDRPSVGGVPKRKEVEQLKTVRTELK